MNYRTFLKEIELNLPYHEELNPRLFDSDKIKSKVRKILLDCAEKFRIGCKIITPEMVTDIVFTGGNANYNYSDVSDIDVHLICDLSQFDKKSLLLITFLKAEKDLWTLTHQVKVFGYPIEMYVQDDTEEAPKGQGVYSLKNDMWLVEPTNLHLNFNNNKILQKKVDYYADLIDSLIKKKDFDNLHVLKQKIKTLRQTGLAKGGEFADGNLVFKALRNAGYLDKMNEAFKEEDNINDVD